MLVSDMSPCPSYMGETAGLPSHGRSSAPSGGIVGVGDLTAAIDVAESTAGVV